MNVYCTLVRFRRPEKPHNIWPNFVTVDLIHHPYCFSYSSYMSWQMDLPTLWSHVRILGAVHGIFSGFNCWGDFILSKIHNYLPDFPPGIQLEFPNQNNFYIAQLGSIPKFPSNHTWVALIPYPFTTQAKFHHTPPDTGFYHFTPIKNPSKHPTYHPSYFPTHAPCNRPTQTLYHTWDITGRLSGPMDHTALVLHTGSHFRVHFWMSVTDTTVNPVVHRG